MEYKNINVKFLLNKITYQDTLFAGDYTVDPYQNCEFGCLYCDSSLDETVYVKINAAEILDKELEKNKKGTIIVGSVHDPYQKAEEQYKLAREILKIIAKHNFSCHILTKSDLILIDLDVLKKIKKLRVTISLVSLSESVSQLFEKNVPSPKTRMHLVKTLNENNIESGIALMPVLPFITEIEFEEIIKAAKQNKAQYFLYKHLELKGDQKNNFIETITKYYPDLVGKYQKLYKNNCMPEEKYITKISDTIRDLCSKYSLKNNMGKY